MRKEIRILGTIALAFAFVLTSCTGDDDDNVELTTFYEDLDGDGVGSEVTIEAEVQPEGYSEGTGDFDDNNANVVTIQDAALAVLESLEGTDTYALETYVSQETYIQHNQTFPDGIAAVIGAVAGGTLAGTTYDNARILTDVNADGDTVIVLHGVYGGTWNGGVPQVAFDVFRFDADSGLIEEHWDNLQDVGDPVVSEANGNTQTDGPTMIDVESYDTEEVRTYIADFTADLLVGGDWAGAGDWFNNDEYIQHSYGTENGIQWILDIATFGFQDVPFYDAESPRYLYVEGDFALIMSQGAGTFDDGMQAYYDLFRVEEVDGQLYIAEHWDAQQAILADADAANSNGKW